MDWEGETVCCWANGISSVPLLWPPVRLTEKSDWLYENSPEVPRRKHMGEIEKALNAKSSIRLAIQGFPFNGGEGVPGRAFR